MPWTRGCSTTATRLVPRSTSGGRACEWPSSRSRGSARAINPAAETQARIGMRARWTSERLKQLSRHGHGFAEANRSIPSRWLNFHPRKAADRAFSAWICVSGLSCRGRTTARALLPPRALRCCARPSSEAMLWRQLTTRMHLRRQSRATRFEKQRLCSFMMALSQNHFLLPDRVNRPREILNAVWSRYLGSSEKPIRPEVLARGFAAHMGLPPPAEALACLSPDQREIFAAPEMALCWWLHAEASDWQEHNVIRQEKFWSRSPRPVQATRICRSRKGGGPSVPT